MSKRTKSQKSKVVEGKDAFKGERSPYWDYLHARNKYGTDGELDENPQANPDVLPEAEVAAPSTPQLLMGEAVTHLQGRQKEVYLLTMREGRSLAEAAQVLQISKGTAQKYMERAIKFIKGYCEQAIAKGRV